MQETKEKDCYVDDGMIRYTDAKVVLAEIPNEITLAINLDNCWFHCPGCHSKFLWKHDGKELTIDELKRLIDTNDGITCVCFMGEGSKDIINLDILLQYIRDHYPDLHTGLYTGRDSVPEGLPLYLINYIKIGHYDKDKGPLNKSTTSQRMYRYYRMKDPDTGKNYFYPKDITNRFWKKA